jgi:hypothetical protein
MEQVERNGWWGDRWTGGVQVSGERVLSDLNTRFNRFRFTGHHSPADRLFGTSTHNIGSPQGSQKPEALGLRQSRFHDFGFFKR